MLNESNLFTVVSGVEELNGAHSADEYETHFDMMTYHEEKAIIFSVTAKYKMENTPRLFTVAFNAVSNKNALLSVANEDPIYFTAADNDLFKEEMLGAEFQLELIKAGAVHITISNPLTQKMITDFVDLHNKVDPIN